jgi:hypothetical protein
MQFIKHNDSTMGCYEAETDQHGETVMAQFCFNLAENPELAQQYLAWLAEGNTPEPWNPEENK